jgi:hypothetical protein
MDLVPKKEIDDLEMGKNWLISFLQSSLKLIKIGKKNGRSSPQNKWVILNWLKIILEIC